MAHDVLYDEEEPSPMAPYVRDDAVITTQSGRIVPVEECSMCNAPIQTMCFKGTGVCGERCRKLRDNQLTIEEAVRGAA